MKKLFILFSILMLVCLSTISTNAALVDNGDGTVTQTRNDGLILMWLKDANTAYTFGYDSDGLMTWDEANSWVAYLNTINYLGYNDWRLPVNNPVDGSSNYNYGFTYNGHTDTGYNISASGSFYQDTASEMSYMFYIELGNTGSYDTIGVETGCGIGGQPSCLTNYSYFTNLKTDYYYWSGSEYPSITPPHAFTFKFNNGLQGGDDKRNYHSAWAVRDAQKSISCVGFVAPMASGPVTVKKNRVLPLKAQLLDTDGNSVTDSDIAALPVFQVLYDSGIGGNPVDVTDDALPAGQGTEDNQFVFTDDLKWQFNLKTKNYAATGTYNISMVSGDDSEYMIDPMCEATFVIE